MTRPGVPPFFFFFFTFVLYNAVKSGPSPTGSQAPKVHMNAATSSALASDLFSVNMSLPKASSVQNA